MSQNPKSMLLRLYGLHSVRVQDMIEVYVVVMGNLFNTTKKIHEKYDLKGSWVSRSVAEHANDPSVLGKDKDLKRKLRLSQAEKNDILSIVEKDARVISYHLTIE